MIGGSYFFPNQLFPPKNYYAIYN